MECVFEEDGPEALTLGGRAGEPRVRLWNRFAPEPTVVQLCLEIAAGDDPDALVASAHGVALAVVGETLTPFLDGLVADFAGWHGVRRWRSRDDYVVLDAAFRSTGRVALTWTLRPGAYPTDSVWTASVTQTLEAGEELRRLADDVRHLLRPGPEISRP